LFITFAVEILESFSNFQHNKMYSYIDKLLTNKVAKYKNPNVDKKSKDIDKSNQKIILIVILFLFINN
jgi:hypothetical protein